MTRFQVSHRHGAHRAFSKVFAFDSESVVKTCPVVFPRDRRCQLYQLRFGKSLAKSGEQSAGHLDRNSRHRIRILKNETFQIREMEVSPVAIQVGDLLFGDAVLSADGRANINSKWTAHQSRDA